MNTVAMGKDSMLVNSVQPLIISKHHIKWSLIGDADDIHGWFNHVAPNTSHVDQVKEPHTILCST